MRFTMARPLRAAIIGITAGALSTVAAFAASLPSSVDLTITGSVGNTVSSTVFPLTASLTSIGAGQEFSFTSGNLITFDSSGFPQTMSGTLGVDISDGQIVLSYSGTAQGVGLGFSLTNFDFGATQMIIDSAVESASSGVINGVNQTNAVSFTDTSIFGGFIPLGFQPNTNLTQTISFTTANAPPPVEPPVPAVPLPASLPFLLAGLGGMSLLKRRKS